MLSPKALRELHQLVRKVRVLYAETPERVTWAADEKSLGMRRLEELEAEISAAINGKGAQQR